MASDELNIEAIEKYLPPFEQSMKHERLAHALINEIKRLRAALGRRGAQEELEQQILKLQTYAMNWQGTEFGGLIERDKVLAALRGVGAQKDV